MKTKEKYNKPSIEVLDIVVEGVIAVSFRVDEAGTLDTAARSKKNFWEE